MSDPTRNTLDRLMDDIPITPAPIETLLTAGRAARRRKRRTLIGGAAVATALVLGGGALATDTLNRPDTPDTTLPATDPDHGTKQSPSNTPTKSPKTPTPTTVQGPDFGPLGPDGFLELRLGMTMREAVDTGRLQVGDRSGACTDMYLAMYGDSLGGPHGYFTRGQGLSLIFGQGTMTTPENIARGSTRAQVRATYSTITAWDRYLLVDASSTTQYFFTFEGNRVASWGLTLRDNPCFTF